MSVKQGVGKIGEPFTAVQERIGSNHYWLIILRPEIAISEWVNVAQ